MAVPVECLDEIRSFGAAALAVAQGDIGCLLCLPNLVEFDGVGRTWVANEQVVAAGA